MTPPSPNVNVKQRVRDFLLSSRLNAWKKKTTGRAGGGQSCPGLPGAWPYPLCHEGELLQKDCCSMTPCLHFFFSLGDSMWPGCQGGTGLLRNGGMKLRLRCVFFEEIPKGPYNFRERAQVADPTLQVKMSIKDITYKSKLLACLNTSFRESSWMVRSSMQAALAEASLLQENSNCTLLIPNQTFYS